MEYKYGDLVELKYFKEGGIFIGYSEINPRICFVEFIDFYSQVPVEWIRKIS